MLKDSETRIDYEHFLADQEHDNIPGEIKSLATEDVSEYVSKREAQKMRALALFQCLKSRSWLE